MERLHVLHRCRHGRACIYLEDTERRWEDLTGQNFPALCGEQTMYVPGHFAEPRVEVMHELIRAQPLATLVTLSSGGLNANHVPLHLDVSPAPFGTLRGHVARANPMASDLRTDAEALAVFHGPEAYVSPSWYATKQESGKVVPTWNYVVVHAYGFLRIVDDKTWLRSQLEALTAHNEASFPQPWTISDAPREYIDRLMGAIVGMEMVITRLIGKWKVSQNQPAANRSGVITGLGSSDSSGAQAMAALVGTVSDGRNT
ncbi:MAG TPA: FMN-binding negative transcriptional regulator [Povalibacter sp.]|nr:FMN-binding negative transcriptional regulator [Povalibacter sp.]